MHGQERRRLATGTLAEFDHSYADTIAELGYPTRSAPRAWRDGHEGTGEVPASRLATNPRHAAETGRRRHRGPGGRRLPRGEGAGRRRARGEGRVRRGDGRATRRAGNGTLPPARGGDGRQWRGTRGEGRARGQGSDDPPDGAGVSRDVPRGGEDAAREGAAAAGRPPGGPGMARKDPGADPGPPADAERAAMATAPGDKYKLCEILPAVGMAKSSYEYARNAQPG